VNIEEAKTAIAQEKRDRATACGKEVDEVLRKHNCSIETAMIVGQAGNRQVLNVIAQDHPQQAS